MRKKLTILLSLLTICCLSFAVMGTASAESGGSVLLEPTRIFNPSTATATNTTILYTEKGLEMKAKPGSTGTRINSYNYTFDESLTIKYKYDSLAPTGVTDGCRFYIKSSTVSSKHIWLNIYLRNSGGIDTLNITISQSSGSVLLTQAYTMPGFDFANVENESVTFVYNFSSKTVKVSFGNDYLYVFDLNFDRNGNPNPQLANLPSENFWVDIHRTNNGLILEEINGQSMATDFFAGKTPNIAENYFDRPTNTAFVGYTNEGILIDSENRNSGGGKVAQMNQATSFSAPLEFTYRYSDLQVPAVGRQKLLIIIIMDSNNSARRIGLTLNVISSTADEQTSDYIMHSRLSVGLGSNQKYLSTDGGTNYDNLSWNVKDYQNTPINIRYNQEEKTVSIRTMFGEKLYDLSVLSDGTTPTDPDILPQTNNLRLEITTTYGGIYLQTINNGIFNFDRMNESSNYTDRKDFFRSDSVANVDYTQNGVHIYNDGGLGYQYAMASGFYTSNDSVMEYRFKYDSLQEYDPAVPLSIIKGAYFNIFDAQDPTKSVLIQPYLYTHNNQRLMFINVILDGVYTYENYMLGYDFADYENSIFVLKYNAVNLTVSLGSDIQQKTIDLTKAFDGANENTSITPNIQKLPSANMRTNIGIQYGGIYLLKMNEFAFVSSIPMQRLVSTISNLNITVNVDNAKATAQYQYWIKTKIVVDGNINNEERTSYVWELVQAYSNTASLTLPDNPKYYDENGKLNIIARIKSSNGSVSELTASYSFEDLNVIQIYSVIVNDRYNEQLNVLDKNGSTVIRTVANNADIDNYHLYCGNDYITTSADGYFDIDLSSYNTGYYNFTVKAENSVAEAEYTFKAYIFGDFNASLTPVVSSLTGDTNMSTGYTEFTVQIKNADGSNITNPDNYTYSLISNGKAGLEISRGYNDDGVYEILYSITYSGYGIFHTVARVTYIQDNAKLEDYSLIYYGKYNRGASLQQSSDSYEVAAGSTLTITSQGDIGGQTENLLYAYYRFAADGWKLIRDYSTEADLIWTPLRPGIYQIQSRVKAADSASYEAVASKTYTILGNTLSEEPTAQIFDYITGLPVNTLIAGNPYRVQVNYEGTEQVQYMYTLYSKDKGERILRTVSLDNNFLLNITKPEDYVLSIKVINISNFGFMDKEINISFSCIA